MAVGHADNVDGSDEHMNQVDMSDPPDRQWGRDLFNTVEGSAAFSETAERPRRDGEPEEPLAFPK